MILVFAGMGFFLLLALWALYSIRHLFDWKYVTFVASVLFYLLAIATRMTEMLVLVWVSLIYHLLVDSPPANRIVVIQRLAHGFLVLFSLAGLAHITGSTVIAAHEALNWFWPIVFIYVLVQNLRSAMVDVEAERDFLIAVGLMAVGSLMGFIGYPVREVVLMILHRMMGRI